jgi:hypothetical protein
MNTSETCILHTYLRCRASQDLASEFTHKGALGNFVPRADPPPFVLRAEELQAVPVIQGTFSVIQGTFSVIQGELSGRP